MKFLTTDDVRTAAMESEKAAIRCTIQHWEQIVTAEDDELQLCELSPALCALCMRHGDDCNGDMCSACSIVTSDHLGCLDNDSLYYQATAAKRSLKLRIIDIHEFREQCMPMLEMLREL